MIPSLSSLQADERSPRVLLLQGPVGPFFRDLHKALLTNRYCVKRVLFNAADWLFAYPGDTVRFSGTPEAWEKWLRLQFTISTPDFIVFFGCMRPAHEVARKLGKEFGVPALSLEEGYLRSGFITCELGGNNHLSQLCDWKPSWSCNEISPAAVHLPSSFRIMCVWGLTYYLWRSWFASISDHFLYHRQTLGPWPDTVYWIKNTLRLIRARIFEMSQLRRVTSELKKQYILVPLQVPSDSQLSVASRGWSNNKLVEEVIAALRSCDPGLKVVFKIHPLDGEAKKVASLISLIAEQNRIASRIIILHSGSISELCRNSSGMIVINSTSAFSALHHNVPILALGDAIYRHPDLVTIGSNARSIADFFRIRTAKDKRIAVNFFDIVKSHALLPGDFYISKGRRAAAAAVTKKILALHSMT